MKRLFPMLMIAVAIVVLPAVAMAEGGDKDKKGRRGPRPDRPNAKALFERFDADGDGQIAVDEMPERMRDRLGKNLDKIDTNGDGKLSLDEFKAVLRAHREAGKGRPGGRAGGPEGMRGMGERGRQMPDIKVIFAKMDTNNDKQLSLEEFTVGAKKLRAHMQGPMRGHMRGHRPEMGPEAAKKIRAKMDERFNQADTNGDGKLSLEEAPERLKKHFDKVDADGDGQLTREELKKAFQDRRARGHDGQRHPPRPPRP